ncbi:hypothetical protein GJ744_006093 [Endocarpon pusillum]|uniref:Letm1 RBD domain-containing protein n=1 Tax=Endocarpon pusillum TaxID=364733 RepID=A0A8H7APP7_9EURO|nr:hypothetical protein GJ744_006093 [Endocarpon pusillum]
MTSTARLVSNGATRRSILSARIHHTSSFASLSRSQHPVIPRDLPSHIRALAILVPRRTYATETTTHGNDGGAFPPPGFNVHEAKKPPPPAKKTIQSSSKGLDEPPNEQHTVSKTEATAVDKTKALEAMTLSELAETKASAKPDEKAAAKKEEEKRLTIGQKIKKELQHYWDGTKLLATEVKISSKLALKMAAGYELSRRENRQLKRTTQDLGRLVPFSVFVIVPFAEFLLPVALKVFPNMLPSTYEGQKSREAKAAHLRSTRKQVSSFLRNTLRETGLPVSASVARKDEFTEFFRKVRATGEAPTPQDVIKVCQTFKDDLTLDNLSRPQLVGMCKYMNLNTFGTDAMLRYQIRHRMRQIKRDDKAISYEGVDSLSVPELQMACASRGLRTHGMSPSKLREDLQMWLDLRLKYNIPSTLLVLSNAYMYTSGKDSEISSQVDALQAVLSSIPEELFHEIELEVHNAEGAATNKQRLEVLKEQQELIEEENEQQETNMESGKEAPKDVDDIDDKPAMKAEDAATKEKAPETASEKEAREAEGDVEEADRTEKVAEKSRQKA